MRLPSHLHRLTASLAAVLAIVLVGTGLTHLTYAASGSLTFSPASGSATVGSTLVVTMHENSGSDATVGVDAFVNYSSNLQFVSATTVAPFNIAPPDSASGGTVEIVRGYAGSAAPTGDQVVSTLTFNVLSAGTGTLTFNAGKSAISPASGSGNLLVTSPGGSYGLSAASSGGGGSTGGGSTSGGGGTAPPASPAAPSSTSKGTSVSIKSTGSSGGSSAGSAVTVPNDGAVAVNTPVSVEPATVQTDGVKKIEYYLSGKLVDTETKAPYKYNINTTKLKNGTYNLVSKTYYSNGTTKQATQHLIVKNAAAHKSLAWLYFLIAGLVILTVLGVNFIGPSTGDPFKKLFKRYTLPPTDGPSVVVGGPSAASTGPAVSGSFSPISPPPGDDPVNAGPAGQENGEDYGRLGHFQPPVRPTPGTTILPPSKSS